MTTGGGGDVKCVISSEHHTDIVSTINNFIGSKASQNKTILSVPRGFRFMIGQITSTTGNHNLSKMTQAYRTTRHVLAAPLRSYV